MCVFFRHERNVSFGKWMNVGGSLHTVTTKQNEQAMIALQEMAFLIVYMVIKWQS